MAANETAEILMYVGTYTRGEDEGIYVYRFDPSSGAVEYLSSASGAANPSFLDLHPDGTSLYSVCEVSELDGKPGGGISAFAIDPDTGSLTLLNQKSSEGKGPCHVSVDATGRFVLTANYGSGSVAILPIQEDGELGAATDSVQHEGSSANPDRQKGPHAHSITVDPGNRYAFAADLGLDKVLIYRLDLDQGKLVPNGEPWAATAPGAGPRHFAFHPNRKYGYVINELDNTVTAFSYDETRGVLTEIQAISTLPDDFADTSYCADVHVHPSGRFLYGSNRGHDSIAIFSIDPETGQLIPAGYEPTQGKNPRNFAIDPTGTFLLAANQDTDSIVVFRIDQETGGLSPTENTIELPKPVCIKMRCSPAATSPA